MNKSKRWATGFLLAVFTAGLIVGGAVSALADLSPARDNRSRRSYTEKLDERLGLSSAQRASVESILGARQAALHQVWKEVQPQYETVRRQARTEILDILDNDQSETFRSMIARSDSTRARRTDSRSRK